MYPEPGKTTKIPPMPVNHMFAYISRTISAHYTSKRKIVNGKTF